MLRVVQQVKGVWRASPLTRERRVYPERAQASPGLRSLRALPNKSGETAGCQHSYRPSLSPPVAHPFGLQFAQFIAPVYLAQSAISARRLQWKNGEARVSQPC
ncbi:hypothetical protein QQF64_032105 [Cirrhinus molitorella]|uniref:Uncharacterized protein n=1 Tax=Cirrhinus molitorella TaxID=172907 RepID=A0ABR3MYX4_9TELE